MGHILRFSIVFAFSDQFTWVIFVSTCILTLDFCWPKAILYSAAHGLSSPAYYSYTSMTNYQHFHHRSIDMIPDTCHTMVMFSCLGTLPFDSHLILC